VCVLCFVSKKHGHALEVNSHWHNAVAESLAGSAALSGESTQEKPLLHFNVESGRHGVHRPLPSSAPHPPPPPNPPPPPKRAHARGPTDSKASVRSGRRALGSRALSRARVAGRCLWLLRCRRCVGSSICELGASELAEAPSLLFLLFVSGGLDLGELGRPALEVGVLNIRVEDALEEPLEGGRGHLVIRLGIARALAGAHNSHPV